jgi:CheY-like chemotaxis protein
VPINLCDARIFLVDDEPILLQIFGAWLGLSGTGDLRTALNGEIALAALKEEPCDILITDVRMPVMDGITLVRSLHETGVCLPIIIFVSGFGDIDEREMYSLGAEAFLLKPIRREYLIEVLERGVSDRSVLWSERMSANPRQSLELSVERMDVGPNALFCLGRGGFSVRSPKPLSLGKIAFRCTFESHQREMVGEGHVRWYSRIDQAAGIEFTFLDNSCRSWITGIIDKTKPRSFIPNCCLT